MDDSWYHWSDNDSNPQSQVLGQMSIKVLAADRWTPHGLFHQKNEDNLDEVSLAEILLDISDSPHAFPSSAFPSPAHDEQVQTTNVYD